MTGAGLASRLDLVADLESTSLPAYDASCSEQTTRRAAWCQAAELLKLLELLKPSLCDYRDKACHKACAWSA